MKTNSISIRIKNDFMKLSTKLVEQNIESKIIIERCKRRIGMVYKYKQYWISICFYMDSYDKTFDVVPLCASMNLSLDDEIENYGCGAYQLRELKIEDVFSLSHKIILDIEKETPSYIFPFVMGNFLSTKPENIDIGTWLYKSDLPTLSIQECFDMYQKQFDNWINSINNCIIIDFKQRDNFS